jgi:uncharacterized damage-inducible protein DinB
VSETQRIADQLKRAFEGEAWHGPAVKEVLTGVSAAQAAARPIAGAHTIWEITAHLVTWEDAVRRSLGGERVQVGPAEDWPPAGTGGETAWQALQTGLEAGHQALVEAVLGFDEARLHQPPGEGRPSPYVLMHGIIQHDLYHAGQIAVLKKGAGS